MRMRITGCALAFLATACAAHRSPPTTVLSDESAESGKYSLGGGSGDIPESVRQEVDEQVLVESAEIQSERAAEEAFLEGEGRKSVEVGEESVTLGEAHPHPEGAPLIELAVDYDVPLVVNDQVKKWIVYFQTRGEPWMRKWLARSGRYLPMMRKMLKEEGIPQDLVYLAMIESGFSTRAYSRARASGPWQFMYATGKMYGLHADWWQDTRRDPEISTHAAARHLKDLYKAFDDWYLAAAAYNAGSGKIRRAIARYKTRDFWELCEAGRYLKPETKNYVPKFLAAALISKHPDRFGFHGIQYQEPLAYDVVTVPDATGLDVIARLVGAELSEIELLNASLRRSCTPPGRSWQIKIPKGQKENFETKFAAMPPQKRLTFRKHVIRQGDTLSVMARRYRTSVAAIKELNKVYNARTLRIGKAFLIPTPAYRAPVGRKVKRTVKRSSAGRGASSRGVKIYHVMAAGETLWDLSLQYGVSVSQIKSWNAISNHRRLQPGKRLTIWGDASSPRTKSLSASAMVYHKVRSGDTVWDIANKYGAKPADVLKLNGLSHRSRIHPGDVLKVKSAP